MKLVYVVPGPIDKKELERRGEILCEWISSDVEIDIVRVEEGPASIESMYEEFLSIPATAKKIYELEQQGYDAAIIGCAGDPGIEAYREITTRMLVVGPGMSSVHAAAMLGYRFSILNASLSTIPNSYELVRKAGLIEKLASIRPLNIPVLELSNDRTATLEKLRRITERAISEDGADSIVLKCMSMGFLHLAEDLQDALGIPVINPVKTSLMASEFLVKSGLSHSNKAFLQPPKLAQCKVQSIDELYVRVNSK
ncbi:hydrogenase expression protein HupH [Bacillus timonensis]|uniref:Hydrogenase expression protein HupH n=1 Tax=Bacillus timonensis TaxID=1033734 RepID=A0A4S3PSQ4_9BACI|nr:aspartate/glutamate racemase family protein [Bacillus timonensis]THE11862.1 hydrogenase expression protein HupH [Bacillus timonensis]